MFAGSQNWTSSPWYWRVTHFSWQTLSLKVYYWAIHHEGQGHKSSCCILPNYYLRSVKIDVSQPLTHFHPDILPLKCTVAAFTARALLFLSQPFFSSSRIQPLSLFQSLHLIHFSPISPSYANPWCNYHTHRSFRHIQRRSRKAAAIAPMNQSHSSVTCYFELHGQASFSSE